MTHARLSLAALMAALPLGLALTLTPARGEDATLIARALAAAGARDWLGADAAAAIADFPRQALHAAELGFEHPVSGRTLSFTSLLPSDMAGLLDKLRDGPTSGGT